jgi:hypothetical protein
MNGSGHYGAIVNEVHDWGELDDGSGFFSEQAMVKCVQQVNALLVCIFWMGVIVSESGFRAHINSWEII